MITNHTQLLNALIEKYNLKSYLEIGVQNPENNFDLVNAPVRVGVDPNVKDYGFILDMESDLFFDGMDRWTNITHFDLIFIDGLHHADQVKRDFENSLRCLSDNGFIVIHDVLPENEEGTIVPRQTKVWWGDVYKFAMNISLYSGIEYITYNIDNGCMVIKRSNKPSSPLPHETDWANYLYFSKSAMNVTDEVTI